MLFELLSDVDRDEEHFAIVERSSDQSGQTYVQAIKDGTGGCIVERREGGPEAHFSVRVPTMREVHKVETAWAFDDPDETAWERVHISR